MIVYDKTFWLNSSSTTYKMNDLNKSITKSNTMNEETTRPTRIPIVFVYLPSTIEFKRDGTNQSRNVNRPFRD